MRANGILMHLSSLPSAQGIGTMGECAREFVRFLELSGQTYWQILPICPTSYGDSPYQSFSTFAGNPYFIDLEMLEQEGLLRREEYEHIDWEGAPDRVNYGALYEKRYRVLSAAVRRFLERPLEGYDKFCSENVFWLDDYALFMTLKDMHGGLSWTEWERPLRYRDEGAVREITGGHEEEIAFWKVVQYLFFRQWGKLLSYANERGILIIGDLPFYVALDSADVWAHPELFQLDENRMPKALAGCPPDGFSDAGQLWGNPLFDWEAMERDDYRWWIQRIGYLCNVYNVLRIDHFRGFDSYYAIPGGAKDARVGRWNQGPGMKLFRELERTFGSQRIIAEDLGFLTDSVRELLRESGFPGMKVLEFAFDSRGDNNEYLPHNYTDNCVAYVGTHDNDTIRGWFQSVSEKDAAYAKEYLRIREDHSIHWEMMRALWGSAAALTIVQAQDLLGLGSESRMNTPSTLGNNWVWRALPGSFDEVLAKKLLRDMELYGRARKKARL